jgi:uncharacterized protein (DUF1015 family)
MARIYPFRAWRYNPSTVRLEDVVTQPCERISPSMQQGYYQRSPFNLIRILLGLPELFDAEDGENVYTRAARDFKSWRQRGVLVQEREPCVFAYAQRFKLPGTETIKERRSFIALGRLHDYAEQVIFPTVQPFAGPGGASNPSAEDRLKLLHATRAHFSPVFMLYSDPACSVDEILFDGNGAPDAELTDESGVAHRVWRVLDPAVIRLLTTAMADKKLIIADGQIGYEAALAYLKEHRPATAAAGEHNPSNLPQPPFPESAVMMTFANMDADGLVILPIYRVLYGLDGFEPAAFAVAAKEFFTVEPLSDADAGTYLNLLERQQGTAFVTITRAGAWLMRTRPDAAAAAPPAVLNQLRPMDQTLLDSILLDRLIRMSLGKTGNQPELRPVRVAEDAVNQVRRGAANISFLTNPVSMDQLREVAFGGEVLPNESTDFFPRLLSGLAIHALD